MTIWNLQLLCIKAMLFFLRKSCRCHKRQKSAPQDPKAVAVLRDHASPPRAIHSRLLVHPRDDQRHRVALIDVPSEEDPLAEHVREWFLVFVHGREFPNKQTNKQTKTNCVSSPATSMARKSEALMGLIFAALHHPHWICRRPLAVPGVLLRLPRAALNISNVEFGGRARARDQNIFQKQKIFTIFGRSRARDQHTLNPKIRCYAFSFVFFITATNELNLYIV